MKKSEKSILGQRLAALRKKPHTNGSDFWKKVRREQERERKKLGIRFERNSLGVWRVFQKDIACGAVWKNMRGEWVTNGELPPHRTRLEAAKALLGEAR